MLTDYLFTCANRHMMNDARAPVFGYQFAHVPTYDVWPGIPRCAPSTGRVCHALELPFVFDNPVTILLGVEPPAPASRFAAVDQAVADAVTAYWTRFATTLDPNRDGLPQWPRYRADDPARLVIGATIAPSRDFDAECALWDSVGYDTKGIFERLGLDAQAPL